MNPRHNKNISKTEDNCQPRKKQFGRRAFLKTAAVGSAAFLTGCSSGLPGVGEETELRWKEFFKKNYRLMTPEQKEETVRRIERLAKIKRDVNVQVSAKEPLDGILFGYAFNLTRCEGYMECVAACVYVKNLDR